MKGRALIFVHAMCFGLLLICEAYGKFNTVAHNYFCRVTFDISYLLMWWYLLSRNMLMCCRPFYANLSIILKELLGFLSSVFRWFSYGISCLSWLIDLYGWFMELIYVADLFMRFICGWYKDSYVDDIKIHMWLI